MSQAMNKKNRTPFVSSLRTALLALCVLGGAVITGCAGDPAVAGQGSPLFGPDIAPLPTASAQSIDMAPDCAGRLGNVAASNFSFEVASLSAGLVAVVDGAGEVICVDSVTDVTSDLDSSGQGDAADAVIAGFLAAAHEADGRDARFSGRAYAGDPEPQPNSRPGAIPDPEPQPN
jgi:hypothetical protein